MALSGVIVDRLVPGNCQLNATLQTLVSAAQNTLQLDSEQRQQTLVRIDAGGGSAPNLNWLLEQGYEALGKASSGQQSRLLVTTRQHSTHDTHPPYTQNSPAFRGPTPFYRPLHP